MKRRNRISQLRARAGFTLLEVIVAMAVGGLVVLGARALAVELADGAFRVAEQGTAQDRDANTERLLRRLLDQVEPGDGEFVRFLAAQRAARFVTWCDSPSGWQERCTVTLGLVSDDTGYAFVALLPGHGIVVLRRGIRVGAFSYLHSPGGTGTWLSSWESTITTPLALRAVLDADTMIIRIGERG